MAAATDADMVGYLDCDIFDFDVIDALDLESSADDEFRGGGTCHYSAIFTDADIISHYRHRYEEGNDDSGAAATCGWLLAELGDYMAEEEEAGSSSSPDSGMMDDMPLTPAATTSEAMSAYVADLERFLLDDDEEQAEGLLGVVDDYFAGDQLFATTVLT